MTACLSHGGPGVYFSNGPSDRLLVGTIGGLICLSRKGLGAPWAMSYRWLEAKHVSALLIEPTHGLVFAGTHDDGLYASPDNGETWHRRDRGIAQTNIYSLSFSEFDGQIRLYAGTEPAHLYVSADLGESWQELASLQEAPSVEQWFFLEPPFQAHLKSIGLDPRSPDTVYAGVEQGAILKSTDAGKTWQELTGLYLDPHRIAILRSRPETVFVSGGRGIYRSPNGGQTWEHLTEISSRIGYPDALLVHPERADLMFTAGALDHPGTWFDSKAASPRIGRSRDGGKSWELVGKGLPDPMHGNIEAMVMEVWPDGLSLFAGTTDGEVFCSEDEGETWAMCASGLPAISKGRHYLNLVEPLPPLPPAVLALARMQ